MTTIQEKKIKPHAENDAASRKNGGSFLAWFSKLNLKPAPLAAVIAALLASFFSIMMSSLGGGEKLSLADNFEEGRVAEVDVIAEAPAVYVDSKATREALEAAVKTVPAVFRFDDQKTALIRSVWNDFKNHCENVFAETDGTSAVGTGAGMSAAAKSRAAADFAEEAEASAFSDAGLSFPQGSLERLFESDERLGIISASTAILDSALREGIFSIPADSVSRYNTENAEVVRGVAARAEHELIPYSKITTLSSLPAYLRREAALSPQFPRGASALAESILLTFLSENVFYSAADTDLNLARVRTEPVTRRIERGERVIKKGFIVTAEDMERLKTIEMETIGGDWSAVLGRLLSLCMVAFFYVLWGGRRILGRVLKDREIYLMSGLTAFYYLCIFFTRSVHSTFGSLPYSVLLPTAIVVMLPSFLVRHRLAFVFAILLPLGAFLGGAMDVNAFVFALGSGIASSLVLYNAQKRMDLLKAGLVIAVTQVCAIIAIQLSGHLPLAELPGNMFWAAFNGLVSGMVVMGTLPVLERLLNAATSFRLIELSDEHSPTLERLFTVAPGTYDHSMMVARLASAACQEIGANAMLARVGAYYHDIGKMEQPEYFVENQSDGYNKHDEIAPRLSATILRSHLRIGVEKAHQLGLPDDVVSIVAEHHGNSLIRYFYNSACEREGHVNEDDFRYPGEPPHTKESACVMLADITEASTRTLAKPSVSSLSKFINERIEEKIGDGQLVSADMTFRELEAVKQSFVRVLAAKYHSRIEYPGQNAQNGKPAESQALGAVGASNTSGASAR
jgi:putative nucleotidyltransferase with HDIG domain